MRVLFWGTPTYAVPTLEALLDAGHEIVGVVSQPDRRRSRGRALQASPVKCRASEEGLTVFSSYCIRKDPEIQKLIANCNADLFVVVAFGQILPKEVLQQPPLGCWNGHGSLLPRWRGAAPIQWSLLSGDPKTGVGIMAMEEGLDTGPLLLQREQSIGLLQNADELAQHLSHLTAKLMVEALPQIKTAGSGLEAGCWDCLGLIPQHQLNRDVTYARLLSKEDYWIDWSRQALEIHRQVMALYPHALCSWRGLRFKVQATEPLIMKLRDQLSDDVRKILDQHATSMRRKPGEITSVIQGLGVIVATGGNHQLLIRKAQIENKTAAVGTALLQQMQVRPGDQLLSLHSISLSTN
ncbi:methionyl-tRNA formyltransferase [cyanobiont of Ornithocercus magnificus]|nr:methionyl-tRNA formyltransferase [cyanobiont of Ornithocercus magnificus]